jgi:hypothetical protein
MLLITYEMKKLMEAIMVSIIVGGGVGGRRCYVACP